MAKQITLEEIQALEHNVLCDVLYGMIDTNHDLYDKLEKMILSSNTHAFVKQMKKEIKSLERRRKFIEYKKSFALSKEIWAMVENIETFLLHRGHDILSSELLKMLMLTDASVYERTDDSAGAVGDAYRYAEEAWVESIAYMDNDGLYDEVIEMLLTDEYGCRDILSETLPEEVLERVFDTYYDTFDDVLSDEGYGEYEVMGILHKCAHYMGSPEHYKRASLLKSDTLDDVELLDIAKEYRYIDDAKNVLEVLSSIDSLPRHKLSELFEMKIWAFDKQGNNTDKAAVYKEFYEKTKEVGVLLKYLEHLEDGVLKEKVRHKALDEVETYNFEEAMRFYKALDEKSLCASYIDSKIDELRTSALYTKELKSLLEWLREQYPQETILLLRDLCESSLATKQSKYYGSSIWALKEMLNIEEENDILSWHIEENSEYIDKLLVEHKNKRAFISLYGDTFVE